MEQRTGTNYLTEFFIEVFIIIVRDIKTNCMETHTQLRSAYSATSSCTVLSYMPWNKCYIILVWSDLSECFKLHYVVLFDIIIWLIEKLTPLIAWSYDQISKFTTDIRKQIWTTVLFLERSSWNHLLSNHWITKKLFLFEFLAKKGIDFQNSLPSIYNGLVENNFCWKPMKLISLLELEIHTFRHLKQNTLVSSGDSKTDVST